MTCRKITAVAALCAGAAIAMVGQAAHTANVANAVIAPPSAALFRGAADAARGVPPPLDSFLSDYVASLELRAYPKPALAAFVRLFDTAQFASAPESDPSQPLYYARFDLQLDAIYAFALEHKWKGALELARRFTPGRGYAMASAYDPIVMQMSYSKEFALGPATARECYSSDGSYPFTGARSLLLGERLSALDARRLAELGMQAAAADRPPPDSAARFLAAVFQALPQLQQQIESAAVAMLENLQAASTQAGPRSAAEQRFSNETGGRIMSVLRAIDPARAQEESQQHPSFAFVAPRPHLDLQLSPGAAGFTLVPAERGRSHTGPAAALTAAAAIQDATQRFTTLVKLAQSLENQHPSEGAQAAQEALALLDQDTLAAAPLAAVRLADVFRALHDKRDAEAVIESCLGTLGVRVQRISARFSGLDPLQMAQKWAALKFAAEPLLLTLFYASKIDARLAESRAKAITFTPLAIMAQASVAAGESGEPDLRNLTSLVGGR